MKSTSGKFICASCSLMLMTTAWLLCLMTLIVLPKGHAAEVLIIGLTLVCSLRIGQALEIIITTLRE